MTNRLSILTMYCPAAASSDIWLSPDQGVHVPATPTGRRPAGSDPTGDSDPAGDSDPTGDSGSLPRTVGRDPRWPRRRLRRMLIPPFLVLLAAAAASVAVLNQSRAGAAASIDSFVTRCGIHFCVDGKPYYAAGTNTGFVADVTISNTGGTTISGWTLAWTFPGTQTITNAWNGVATQTAVSVKDAGYNSTIAAGGSTSIGFQATFSGTNTNPTAFTLNGGACTAA